MGRLVEIFIEWAKKEQRWPLLILLAMPVSVKLVQEYFQISFRESMTHWLTLIGNGTLLLVSGALYCYTRSAGLRERLWLAGPLILIGVVAVATGALEFRTPPLPADRLVVAIARMTAVPDKARDDADNFAALLDEKLRDKENAGLPLEVKRLSAEIRGATMADRREAAIGVAKSQEGAAHVVLWGEVRWDEGQLRVEPHLTVARPLGQQLPEERSIGRRTSDGPSHIEFREQLATDITEMLTLVYGLAVFNAGRWQDAAEIFRRSDLPETLYHAISLFELSRDRLRKTWDTLRSGPADTVGPMATLDSAKGELLEVHQAFLKINDLDLAALSLINLGNVLRIRKDWNGALKAYEEAQTLASKSEYRDYEARAGVGKAVAKLQGRHDLRGALTDIEHAISLYKQGKDLSSLFRTLDWKAQIQGELGDLNGAIKTYDHAFSLNIDDPETLFSGHLHRAEVYYDMLERMGSRQLVDAAADSARADYEEALELAESLGWTGLAAMTRELIEELETKRVLSRAALSSRADTRKPNGMAILT